MENNNSNSDYGRRIKIEPQDNYSPSMIIFPPTLTTRRRRSFSSYLGQCRRNGTFCDIQLYAGSETSNIEMSGSPIFAHKLILAATSEFFEQRLLSTHGSLSNNEIFVDNVTTEILEILIDYLYSGRLEDIRNKISSNNILNLFQAGQELGLDEVSTLCHEQLQLHNSLTVENCVLILSHAYQMKFAQLMETAVNFLLGNLATVLPSENFCNLSYDLMQLILKKGSNNSEYCTTTDLILSVSTWLKFAPNERRQYLMDLLSNFSVRDHQGILRKIFIEDMDDQYKQIFYEPMIKLLMSAIVRETPPTVVTVSSTTSTGESPELGRVPTPISMSTRCRTPSSGSSGGIFMENNSFRLDHHHHHTPLIPHNKLVKPEKRTSPPPPSSALMKKPKKSKPFKYSPSMTPSSSEDDEYTNDPRRRHHSGHSNHDSHQSDRVDRVVRPMPGPSPSSTSSPASTFTQSTTPNRVDEKGDAIVYFFAHVEHDRKRQLWAWHIKDNSYKFLANVSAGTSFNSTLLYHKDDVYVIGGKYSKNRGGEPCKEICAFHTTSGSWRPFNYLPKMAKGRLHSYAAVVEGELYADSNFQNDPGYFGITLCALMLGARIQREYFENSQPMYITCSERLLLHARPRKWEEAQYMRGKRALFGCAVLHGKIYAVGGRVQTDEKVTHGTVERYDPVYEQWSELKPMLIKRTAVSSVASDKFVFALGGSTRDEERISSIEFYCPIKDCWENGPSMIRRRRFASAVFWKARNEIYIMGGDDKQHPTVEKLNLDKMQWEMVGELKPEGNFTTVAYKECF